MQKKKKMAIIGGDARYLPLIHALHKWEWLDIEIVGFEKVEQSYTGVRQALIDELNPSIYDAIVLPITGIDDKGFVEAVFSNRKIQLSKEWFQKLPKHCIVFTGISNQTLDSWCENLYLTKLMERDDIAIYNSIPTAEGAIMLAIKHTDITIHHANVFVYGFGRVGKTTAKTFSGLGANVTVVSRSETELSRAYEQGYETCSIKDSAKAIASCEILINTIPALVVDEAILERMSSNALIIDLASKPGGIDFNFAKKRGMQAIHALGMPGLVAPKTAGEILANTIEKLLEETS